MSKITAPGIYDMPAPVYHADPCPQPSLSNSIARVLLDESPLHARHAHPRLGAPAEARDPTTAMDMGTALHALLLGKGADVIEINAPDWRTKSAKELRDMARDAGQTPLLAEDYDRIHACAEVARAELAQRADCAAFRAPGRAEAVMAWQEGDVWCRSMVDWLPDDPRAALFDVKGTMLSANPSGWDRRLVQAYRTQAAFYARGARALRGVTPQTMRFVVIEMRPPFALSVMTLAPSLMAVAEADVDRAIRTWGRCLRDGAWPAYPHLAHVEAPSWLLREEDERESRDSIIGEAA